MFNSIEYANTNAQKEATEIWEDLDSLSKKILKKTSFFSVDSNGKTMYL